MTILHIAQVGEDRFSGVNVAVPAQIKAQTGLAEVGFLNLSQVRVPGIPNQFSDTKGMGLDSLPEPFSAPDLVVFHEIYRPPFLALARQAAQRGIPYVIVPHGGLTVGAQKIKAYKKIPANLLLFGRFIRGAAAVQCLSQRELDQTRFPVPKFIGTNGITLGGPKTTFSERGMRFAYIGRLDFSIKGLDLLLEAMGREKEFLLENGCRVDLYGPDEGDSREKLTQLQKRLGLEDLLGLHQGVSGEEKDRILAGTDCYIQTSRSEGMSMGILEALGWGIPCLVTQGTGMADLVEAEQAGWGCRTGAEAIGDALRQAVRERNTLPEKSVRARNLVEERFTWQRVSRDTMAHYRQILSRSRSV